MVVGEETKILTSNFILTVGTTSVAVSFAGEIRHDLCYKTR